MARLLCILPLAFMFLISCAGQVAPLTIPAACLAPVSASLALAGHEKALSEALRLGAPIDEESRQSIAALLDSLEVARTQCRR